MTHDKEAEKRSERRTGQDLRKGMTTLGITGEHHQESVSQESKTEKRGKRERLEIVSYKKRDLGGMTGWGAGSPPLRAIIYPQITITGLWRAWTCRTNQSVLHPLIQEDRNDHAPEGSKFG